MGVLHEVVDNDRIPEVGKVQRIVCILDKRNKVVAGQVEGIWASSLNRW